MDIRAIFLSIVLLVSFQVIAQPVAENLAIPAIWKFTLSDSPEYATPGFDDSAWKTLKSAASWESQGYANQNCIGWYRNQIVIPASLQSTANTSNCLKISLGKIDDGDETYFNGEKIGQMNYYHEERDYIIPYRLIKWGQVNTIAVRVKDNGGDGGLYAGICSIGQPNKLALFIADNMESSRAIKISEGQTISKTLQFKLLSAFDKLNCTLNIEVLDMNSQQSIYKKTETLLFSGSTAAVYPFSFVPKKTGNFILKYSLKTDMFADSISNKVFLAYVPGNHQNEKITRQIAPLAQNGAIKPFMFEEVKLEGYLGERVEANLTQRLLNIDEMGILECYYNRPGKQTWAGEYTGKYLHAASRAWRNSGNIQLKEQMDRIVDILLLCQLNDGYLGTYAPKDYWTDWDVWAHKYNMLGLLSYYEATGYVPALEASKKMADLLMRTFGTQDGQRHLVLCGGHAGMASTSVLEPFTDLYRFTGEKKHLDFCHYILQQYETSAGAHIISTLNSVGKVEKVGNAKAYEMMSNFTGIVKLYQLTGDKSLLSAVETGWNDIVENKLYITGTCSEHEFFQPDHVLPAGAESSMGEGCVTTTWVQVNQVLYNLTGEAKYVDEIEKSIYNHLLAAENPTTGCVSYYTPLQGIKPYRCTINAHCCLASIPRGIAAVPEVVFASNSNSGLKINLYTASKLKSSLNTDKNGKVDFDLSFSSAFPEEGKAEVVLSLAKPATFDLELRAPNWCNDFVVVANGQTYKGEVGKYLKIKQKWAKKNVISISFDSQNQLLDGGASYPGFVAVKHGAQILAIDKYLNPAIKEIDKIEIHSLNLKALPESELPDNWFGKQLYSLDGFYEGQAVKLILVPYAEAGQTGGDVRVWIKN